MNRLLNKITSYVTTVTFVGSLFLPTARAMADECSTGNVPCITVTVGGQQVTYPQLNLKPIASLTANTSGGFNLRLGQGDQKRVDLNAAASTLGISSSQIAQVISTLPASSNLVYSRLSGLNNLLDVTILKVQKTGKTTTLYYGKFTPEMGERWAASQTFMTAAEKEGSTGPGPNPFQSMDQGDGEFHNVGLAQAQAVTGLAARFVEAPVAVLNIANFNLRHWVTTSHHLFTTTTTVHDAGDETPVWYIGLPSGMNPTGDVSANYCLDALVGNVCPVPEHQVVSGLAWSNWTGGNLPYGTTTIHEFDVSHTGLNIIVVALIVSAISFGLFSELGPVLLAQAGVATGTNAIAGVIGTMLNTGLTAAGVTASATVAASVGAALDGLAYMAAAMAAGGGGPFSPDNLALSNQATVPGQNSSFPYSSYWEGIEGQAVTAPLGQESSQVDTSGNNGFKAFTTFDQGYNNDVAPTPSVNVQFNSMQYIQDTQ